MRWESDRTLLTLELMTALIIEDKFVVHNAHCSKRKLASAVIVVVAVLTFDLGTTVVISWKVGQRFVLVRILVESFGRHAYVCSELRAGCMQHGRSAHGR